MSYLKTKENDADVMAFLNGVDDKVKREDCLQLIPVLEEITGFKAKMWGSKIIGFGNYTYKTKAGKEGEWFLIGFSPAKANLSFHLMYGLEEEAHLLAKLGKHKIGKGCLYVKTLSDVDHDVLKQLMTNTYAHMKNATK